MGLDFDEAIASGATMVAATREAADDTPETLPATALPAPAASGVITDVPSDRDAGVDRSPAKGYPGGFAITGQCCLTIITVIKIPGVVFISPPSCIFLVCQVPDVRAGYINPIDTEIMAVPGLPTRS
jgi:hypothetical protein